VLSKNTRCCGKAELLGTDGYSDQEGGCSILGKDGVWSALKNTVKSSKSSGCTLHDDEFWGRAWSDNIPLSPWWNTTLSQYQQTIREAAAQNRHTCLDHQLGLGRWSV
jgi:hypothetical protein